LSRHIDQSVPNTVVCSDTTLFYTDTLVIFAVTSGEHKVQPSVVPFQQSRPFGSDGVGQRDGLNLGVVVNAYMSFTPFDAFFLLPAMIVLQQLGHGLRLRRQTAPQSSAVEGAVFALFGLLLAFTFSGAVARYDAHRELVTEERNYIETAFLRLDLLPSQDRPRLRQLFRDYVDSRLHLYNSGLAEISPATEQLKREIWQESVADVAASGANPDATRLVLPALNNMFDITATRLNAFNMHPPSVVFWLLFILSGGSAFLAGFGMSAPTRSWFYTIAFALAVTLTVYATLEIEYPSQGLIRLTNTDQVLTNLRDSMK
jgi:hypothetical protein